jgi:hypothetical protein
LERCTKNLRKLSRIARGGKKDTMEVTMKIKYRCSERYKNENSWIIIKILEEEKIKYNDIMGNGFVFYLHSDNERTNEILGYLQDKCYMEAIFSKEEMENANWYTFEATRHDIETSDQDFTFKGLCPYESEIGIRYRHAKQVNLYLSKRTPKWKNNYNFCSVNTGDFNKIFCSDIAKMMIENRNITGVEFLPVVNRKNIPTENVSQLRFPNILPREAFVFIGEYTEMICPTCGRINYEFVQPMYDNMRIKTELIPDGIDMFSAQMSISRGWIVPPIIVSKRFYNLVVNEMKEKHVRFMPIG